MELRSKATGSLDDQVNENEGLAMTCRQRWSAVKSSRAEAGRIHNQDLIFCASPHAIRGFPVREEGKVAWLESPNGLDAAA